MFLFLSHLQQSKLNKNTFSSHNLTLKSATTPRIPAVFAKFFLPLFFDCLTSQVGLTFNKKQWRHQDQVGKRKKNMVVNIVSLMAQEG